MDEKLVWTDAKPTVPGLWLWRRHAIDHASLWKLFNVELRRHLFYVECGKPFYKFPDGQFAGPIPQPAEPR